jgi:phytoene dehydrogenase-like protein
VKDTYDFVVVGSGPNGMAAAITLAQAGRSVLVVEAKDEIGGGTRSAELTLPGFTHDICATILPLAVASPFLRQLKLEQYGLEYIYPPAALAHPLDSGPAVLLEGDVEKTSQGLGKDAGAYRRVMETLVSKWEDIVEEFLGPFPFPPRYPWADLQFGLQAIWPASWFIRSNFGDVRGRALFAGLAAHAIQPLEWPATTAFALMEGMIAHGLGWPLVQGGSAKLSQALGAYFVSLGGKIQTGKLVECLDDLPAAQAVLFDVTPRQLLRIAGQSLPKGYNRQLSHYRYGPGLFKIDYALNGPIPWKDPACLRAATVHIGGTFEEIAASERTVWKGEYSEKPFLILAQQSLFDPCRAPQAKHTAWVYCHVPNGSTVDMTNSIEKQIERFAPGFRDQVLARHISTSQDLEHYNPNYIGGDINGGVQDLRQLFTRPVARLVPYSTPNNHIYICSSSTPPGGGVHGMCGYYAAMAVLRKLDPASARSRSHAFHVQGSQQAKLR